MAIKVCAQNEYQVIVPVRFERAASGSSQWNVPDFDTRGWDMHQPSGWSQSDARGPMFGVTVGDTVKLKVVPEDIDDSAPLYATVSEASQPQVELAEPAGSGPVPSSGVIKVKGIADTSSAQVVEIRLGGTTGPVVAAIEAHCLASKSVFVTPHLVQISSSSITGDIPISAADLAQVFTQVKAIYQPAGIRVSVATPHVSHHVTNASEVDACLKVVSNDNAGNPTWNSIVRITQLGWVAGRCNMYFVSYLDGGLGLGVSYESKSDQGFAVPACVVATQGHCDRSAGTSTVSNYNERDSYFNLPTSQADWIQELANDVAHELGHFLTLWHAGMVNDPGRKDTYARRQLMHPNNLMGSSGGAIRLSDIGYGKTGAGTHRGCMLSLKDLPGYAEVGEWDSNDDAVTQAGSEVTRLRARLPPHANLYRA